MQWAVIKLLLASYTFVSQFRTTHCQIGFQGSKYAQKVVRWNDILALETNDQWSLTNVGLDENRKVSAYELELIACKKYNRLSGNWRWNVFREFSRAEWLFRIDYRLGLPASKRMPSWFGEQQVRNGIHSQEHLLYRQKYVMSNTKCMKCTNVCIFDECKKCTDVRIFICLT